MSLEPFGALPQTPCYKHALRDHEIALGPNSHNVAARTASATRQKRKTSKMVLSSKSGGENAPPLNPKGYVPDT